MGTELNPANLNRLYKQEFDKAEARVKKRVMKNMENPALVTIILADQLYQEMKGQVFEPSWLDRKYEGLQRAGWLDKVKTILYQSGKWRACEEQNQADDEFWICDREMTAEEIENYFKLEIEICEEEDSEEGLEA